MGYDLYFRPGPKKVTVEMLRQYFQGEPRFLLLEERAAYENEATGVYFGFDFEEGEEVPVIFRLNYFRPHVFGLEAEPVLRRFVENFHLTVDDPQHEGMGVGPYSAEGFLRAWLAGNRSGYRACLTMPGEPPPALPSARLEAVWRWNFAKEAAADYILDPIGEVPPCFVPTALMLVTPPARVMTCVVWDLDMAIALPGVDLVVTTGKAGHVALPTAEVLEIAPVHSTWDPGVEVAPERAVGMKARLIDGLDAEVSSRLRKRMRPFSGELVGMERVLDAEVLEEVMREAKK